MATVTSTSGSNRLNSGDTLRGDTNNVSGKAGNLHGCRGEAPRCVASEVAYDSGGAYTYANTSGAGLPFGGDRNDFISKGADANTCIADFCVGSISAAGGGEPQFGGGKPRLSLDVRGPVAVDVPQIDSLAQTTSALGRDLADGTLNFDPSQTTSKALAVPQIAGGESSEQATTVCFTAGALIKTAKGEVAIEDLVAGDRVLTMDEGYQAIRWIGGKTVSAADRKVNPQLNPIRIRAGAMGQGLPENDLMVSPQHRVLISSATARRIFGEREILIPAHRLVALDGVDVVEDETEVSYWHMLFDSHQIVWSNGMLTESLFTGPEALASVAPEAREEILMLFPHLLDPEFLPQSARCIPNQDAQMMMLVQYHVENNKPILDLWDAR